LEAGVKDQNSGGDLRERYDTRSLGCFPDLRGGKNKIFLDVIGPPWALSLSIPGVLSWAPS